MASRPHSSCCGWATLAPISRIPRPCARSCGAWRSSACWPYSSSLCDQEGDPPVTLDGQVSIVTGAGRGIGREIAIAQARAGAKVALLARSADQLDQTAHAIAEAGG